MYLFSSFIQHHEVINTTHRPRISFSKNLSCSFFFHLLPFFSSNLLGLLVEDFVISNLALITANLSHQLDFFFWEITTLFTTKDPIVQPNNFSTPLSIFSSLTFISRIIIIYRILTQHISCQEEARACCALQLSPFYC